METWKMLKRKHLMFLATLAALGLPCLAMSNSFTTYSPEAPVRFRPVRPGTADDESQGATAEQKNTIRYPSIRRTPPVIPSLRLLPPLPAEDSQLPAVEPQSAMVIPASSVGDEPGARQVAATLPASDDISSANLSTTKSSRRIETVDRIQHADVVSPWSARQLPAAEQATTRAMRAPLRLIANNLAQDVPAPPPAPEPIHAGQTPYGVEAGPARIAEPVPAADDLTMEAPMDADESVAGDWEYGDGGYGDAGYGDCGHGNCGACSGCLRRRPPPTVCYRDRPFGWPVRNVNQMQVARGLQDQMVLYDYDFQEGANADQLSSQGRHQLEKFAQWVASCGFPVVIQPSEGRPELEAARQAHVAMELAAMTPAATENSVVVARPRAPGLRGQEALIIDSNLIRQTQARGRLMTGSGGGGFGFDSSGIESGVGGSSQ
jgi:hypothetical protein